LGQEADIYIKNGFSDQTDEAFWRVFPAVKKRKKEGAIALTR
jgi:hypothetical protein